MKRLFRSAVPCLLLLALSCAARVDLPDPEREYRAPGSDANTRSFIDEATSMVRAAMSAKRIPGLSIVVTDARETIWEAGFGFTDDARSVPVDPMTLFSVQSMSKTFTAVGVLSAVRAGRLDLDAPIARYLPGFTVGSIFEDRPEQRITLRHLLTHTAGFAHEAPGGGNFDPGEPSFDEHVAAIARTWLRHRVGARSTYSNLGIDLAGFILQTATGMSFARFMDERVFAGLGMLRTTMDVGTILAEPNRAVGHQGGFPHVPVRIPMTAAGGAYTDAHDLGLFLRWMLDEGAHGPSTLPGPAELTQMRAIPVNGSCGLGVAVGKRGDDLFLNHGGGGYGFSSWMAWYPTLGIGIAVLTNSADHGGAHVELATRVVDRLVARGIAVRSSSLAVLPVCGNSLPADPAVEPYFRDHAGASVWKDEWARYLGTYLLSTYARPAWYARLAIRFGFVEGMRLRVARKGDAMLLNGSRLYETLPGLFFTEDGEALDFRGQVPTWRNIKIRQH